MSCFLRFFFGFRSISKVFFGFLQQATFTFIHTVFCHTWNEIFNQYLKKKNWPQIIIVSQTTLLVKHANTRLRDSKCYFVDLATSNFSLIFHCFPIIFLTFFCFFSNLDFVPNHVFLDLLEILKLWLAVLVGNLVQLSTFKVRV